jgi:hypothetical protein
MKKLLLIAIVSISCLIAGATPVDTVSVSVQVGGASKSSAMNVVDMVTGSALTANITNVSIQNSNPETAKVSVNTANTREIIVSPIAGGFGTATVSCHVTYVDAGDGLLKSEDKTVVISYTVIYNPPHGAKLSFSFN